MANPLAPNASVASMLQTLRAQQAQTQAPIAPKVQQAKQAEAVGQGTPAISFEEAVKTAVSKVNEMQLKSAQLQDRYARGDTELPLADVVVGMQKSSLAFEATLQVRNKVLKAYQDIMSMPV